MPSAPFRLVLQALRVLTPFCFETYQKCKEALRGLGSSFTDRSTFSVAMILNSRPRLCPDGILIEKKPAEHPDTRIKMDALGIGPERVWTVPSFEPPGFPSARLFIAGLPWSLVKLDAA